MNIDKALKLYNSQTHSIREITVLTGISQATLYRYTKNKPLCATNVYDAMDKSTLAPENIKKAEKLFAETAPTVKPEIVKLKETVKQMEKSRFCNPILKGGK
jgi:transposase